MKRVFHIVCSMISIGLPALGVNNMAQAAAVPVTNFFEKDGQAEGTYSFGDTHSEYPINDVDFWELPSSLKDVSGIKYLGNNRFACIQDQRGAIFIYNTASSEIEKEIAFSEPADFEGIAIAGQDAYVVQSDGKLYEVINYLGNKPVVHQYKTFLTAKHNVEGLTYDKNNNRLLLAIKGVESKNNNYKGIYAFDLKSKHLTAKPVVKINLKDPFFSGVKEKGANNTFQPSAIEIHPVTHDIYILQGTDPKLLVMDAKGHIKRLYTLDRSRFPQAEGLAFTPKGELFVSNEGKEGAATIVGLIL